MLHALAIMAGAIINECRVPAEARLLFNNWVDLSVAQAAIHFPHDERMALH